MGSVRDSALSLWVQAKRAKQDGSLAALKAELAGQMQARQAPAAQPGTLLEQQRILTEEDFERIRCCTPCC